MKFPSAFASILFAFVGTVSAQSSTTVCASQTAIIQQNDGFEQAERAYNAAVVNQTLACILNAQSPCDLNLDAEESAIEQACVEANGMMYTPSLLSMCVNYESFVTTTWKEDYEFCIGLNCTNTADVEALANELLANTTAVINRFLSRRGVTATCSAQVNPSDFPSDSPSVSSSANCMSFSGWLVAMGMSGAMLFAMLS
jgi:hypothetical protein